MSEKEIRIFPNSQKYEFKTEEELADYIRNTLRGPDRNGRYNLRRIRPVKNVSVGSIPFFRFKNKIMGWGEVSEKAEYSPFNTRDGDHYEGFIMFRKETVKVFEPPLLIKDMENLTGKIFHFKDNYNTGRAYYRIPFGFKEAIKSVVKEV